jgi:hypothetical protein
LANTQSGRLPQSHFLRALADLAEPHAPVSKPRLTGALCAALAIGQGEILPGGAGALTPDDPKG